MNKAWPLVPLAEVLVRSEETVDIVSTDQYKEVTIRLWGKGVVQRGEVQGQEMAATKRFRVRPGQFILSRIDARNGTLGIVPETLDAVVVSNDFPAYNIVTTRLLPPFLGWTCRTRQFVDLCHLASEGTTNRVRLQEDRFLQMAIPFPPLSEQRRIVAKIEELAAKANEARGLRSSSAAHVHLMLHHTVGALFNELAALYPMRSFGSFEPRVTSGPRDWAKGKGLCREWLGVLSCSGHWGVSLPFPPHPEQRPIVAYLDELQAKADSIKALQARSAAELDALLPSILDRAFKGEL